jgi:hypothetical protein
MAKAFLRSVRSGKRKSALADLASVTRHEVEGVLDTVVKRKLVQEHEKIVKDWTSDVGFAARKVIKPDSISVYVFPTGKDKMVWIYVDKGTKPHTITAKKAPRLAFQMRTSGGKPVRGGYTPKTLPGVVVAGGGYVRPPKTLVRPYAVDHPGNEPRGFTLAIAEDFLPFFRKEMENAFRRVTRRTYE